MDAIGVVLVLLVGLLAVGAAARTLGFDSATFPLEDDHQRRVSGGME